MGLKEIKEGICKVDHGLGVIIDTLEGTEGENFGGWLVTFLGDIMSVARDVAAKAGQGAGQGQEEVEEGSSSGSSSSSSSTSSFSSSSVSEDDDNEGNQGKGDEGKTIMGSWKVINVYLEEERGGKNVKVRGYKCPETLYIFGGRVKNFMF